MDERNGFDFVYFLIKVGRIRRDTSFLLPPDTVTRSRWVGVSHSWLALFFYQRRVRRWEGVSCSLVAGLLICGTMMWHESISYKWSWSNDGNAGHDLAEHQCSLTLFEMHVKCNVWWFSLSWSSVESTDFLWTFVDCFIAQFRIELPSKKLREESSWLFEKTIFLIENLFLHFNRMDVWSLLPQRRVLFILVPAIIQPTSG